MKLSPLSFVAWAVLTPGLVFGDNLLNNASFEAPKVDGTVESKKGGNPVLVDDSSWTQLQSQDRTGKLNVGLTNALGRTGKQSVFVAFNKALDVKQAFLMSDILPIVPEELYRISIWGRLDAKRPLALDEGLPVLQVQLEFYAEDQATQIGDTQVRTQLIPGGPKHILFTSTNWNEYFTKIRAPQGAEFMKVSFYFFAPKVKDPADGIIYLDDAVVDGPKGKLVPSADPPEPKEDTAANAGAPATPPAAK